MKQKFSRLIKPSKCLLRLDGSIFTHVISLSFNTKNSVLKDINAPQTHPYKTQFLLTIFFQVSFSFLWINIIFSLLENLKETISFYQFCFDTIISTVILFIKRRLYQLFGTLLNLNGAEYICGSSIRKIHGQYISIQNKSIALSSIVFEYTE